MTCPGWDMADRDGDGPEDGESRCALPAGHRGLCATSDGWWFLPMNPQEVRNVRPDHRRG